MWGIYFIGPFSSSFAFVYILLVIDYVSKWVEALATRTNDHKVVVKLVKEYIFGRYGTPRALISDGVIILVTDLSRLCLENIL